MQIGRSSSSNLEASIIEDVKAMFRDEQLITRIWNKVSGLLDAAKPALNKEIRKVEERILKTRARIDRYFNAFEQKFMRPEVCSEKVGDLNSSLGELEAEKKKLEARRKKLELPALDKEKLRGLIDRLDEVMASGEARKKRHLLHLLVKNVLIHDRRTVEVWYSLTIRLPQGRGCENWDIWLPGRDLNPRQGG